MTQRSSHHKLYYYKKKETPIFIAVLVQYLFKMSRQVKEFLYGRIGIEKYSKEFVIVFANYVDTGKANLDAELNIINARAAGIENVDIYITPCVQPSDYKICGNARESITAVLDHLNKNNAKFGRVWLNIDGLTGCEKYKEWNKDNKTENIEFIDEMVNTLEERKRPYGFYTDKYNWHEITGNTRKYNDTPLIYYHFDDKNNFDDYNEYGYPFGGWEKPTMKRYIDTATICEIEVSNIFKN
uniref:Uncharacterized protein n=1 Tax=Meloidogyne enterolobii TaxID=390850 RepID=A0A6V7WFP1_MELEN|nr:unnamed protein product [Meloidogyne enterolobii]